MDIEKIGTMILLSSASHNIVEASKDTERMIMMCMVSNQPKLAEKAIDIYFEFLLKIIPKTIEYFERLDMKSELKKSRDFLRDVEIAVEIIKNGGDRNYTLDEILKQAGVKTDGNGER